MTNVSSFVQKYRQASWRVQRQWLGLILLGVVLTVLTAAGYLSVTTRSALTGRYIQIREVEIIENLRFNADLETNLATSLSIEALEKRAEAMGYRPAKPEDITYLAIPGYTAGAPFMLATTNSPPIISPLRPEYTESLFDWLARKIQVASLPEVVR